MKAASQITLESCPHCAVTRPVLSILSQTATVSFAGTNPRVWSTYKCSTCGGVTLTEGPNVSPPSASDIRTMWPAPKLIADAIPSRAKAYLIQAHASRHAPAGAIMLTGSAIDAMLKEKGLRDGSLYSRIEAAAEKRLITDEMAAWAHEIRLDANDQRHSDEAADLPAPEHAERVLAFADALGEFLFVLPAMVTRGRKA